MRGKKFLDAREPFSHPWTLVKQRSSVAKRREIDLDDLGAALPRKGDGAPEHGGSFGVSAELELRRARHAAP